MQQTEFKHIYPMNVRWSDQDILGHVNNVQLIRYLECGRVAYCNEVMGLDFIPQTNAGWILADLQCTFHSQSRFPGRITVATRFIKMGNSSAHLDAAIYQDTNDRAVVTSRAVVIWFDYAKQTSVRIPDDIRRKILHYEQIGLP
jgi:acyl-CoA thioester hydrolase